MRFGRTGRARRTAIIELAPMIDVVFLLIVFFMVAATFAKRSFIELDLPNEAGRGAGHGAWDVVINIDREGRVVTGDQEGVMTRSVPDLLAGAIGQWGEETRVLVRADRRASSESLNRVMDDIRNAGVRWADLATQPGGGVR